MTIWKTSAIVGILVLVLGIVFSCSKGGRFCKGHGGEVSSRVLEHIDDKVADLNLDEAQEEKYQRLRSRLAADMASHKTGHKQFVEALHGKLDQEEPDIRELTGLVREEMSKMPDFLEGCLGLLEEFYDILDKDQKARFMKDVKEKMKKHHSMRKSA